MTSADGLRCAAVVLALGLGLACTPARAEMQAQLVPAAARADQQPRASTGAGESACRVSAAAMPRSAREAGCRRAWCTALGAERWCVCESVAADGSLGHRYLTRPAAGAPARSWPAEVSPMLGAGAFGVLSADLDGDGRDERLVVQRIAVSNGMAVAYARLCTWGRTDAVPMCREVQDWGALSGLVREPGRAGCSLLDAGWEPGEEPGRGAGTYALARLMRWDADGWHAVALTEQPMLARRLTRTFARERTRLTFGPTAALWTRHPAVRTVRCPDLLCEAERAR